MAYIHISDLELAINYWRQHEPSVDGISLPGHTRVLAEIYAHMVYSRVTRVDEKDVPKAALAAWHQWYATTPDTPCIAICSTSQGDAVCRGCGRTFEEVQLWPQMTPVEKRVTWRRITDEGTAWRFNKYAERAIEGFDALSNQ